MIFAVSKLNLYRFLFFENLFIYDLYYSNLIAFSLFFKSFSSSNIMDVI